MRKYFLSFVALAAGLFATSCQESIVEPQIAGPTTFTVQLPEQMGTKAFGDETSTNATIDSLFVEVYSEDGNTLIYEPAKAIKVEVGKATFTANLIQDQKYDIIFWAQKGNAYNTSDLRSIPMENRAHNVDDGAAFFAFLNDFVPAGASQSVVLRRPFAQLNLGTTDESLVTNAGTVKLSQSSIQVEKVAATFNTVLGVGEGEQTVQFALANVPTIKLNVGGIEYNYVSMDYLPIAGDDQALVNVNAQITLDNGQVIDHTFTSVPVRENYRTNIVGNLISSTTDFEITIEEGFVDENGNSNPDNNYTFVSTPEELQEAINNGVNNIILEEDINLDGSLIFGVPPTSPIARASATEVPSFVLDLGGNTITTNLQSEGRHYYAINNYANLTIVGEGAIYARGIQNFGTMTIDGDITITNIDTNGGAAIWNEGDITINAGTFISGEDGPIVEGSYGGALNTRSGGKAIVNGGTFKAYSKLTYAIINEGETIINNATVKGRHGAVAGAESNDNTKIYGGSFEQTGVQGQSDHCVYFVTEISGGSFAVEQPTDAGGQVFYRSNIADGYQAVLAADGETYVVLPTSENYDIVITDPAQLNGEVLTNYNNILLQLSAGKHTIDLYMAASFDANLTIIGTKGTKVEFAELQVMMALVKNFTIKNCEILHMATKSWGHIVFGSGNKADGVYTIENCTFNGVGTQGIYINEDKTGAIYNIVNCTFNGDFGGEGAITIQTNKDVYHTVNVEGCKFNNIPETCHRIFLAPYDGRDGLFYDFTLNTDLKATTAYELEMFLALGQENVVVANDIYSEAATIAPYGNKYGYKMDGGILDGNGHKLDIECYGDDYGIMTSGGTIKNLTIENGTRAVMIMYVKDDVILDNVRLGGEGVLYPINTGEEGDASQTAKLIVSNSTLAGWTSYSYISSASFTNVEFKQGTYYNNIYGRVLKPYVNTTLTNCSFIAHMNLDLSSLTEGHKIVIENCTVNGQLIAADVFTVPSCDNDYDTKLFTVDLPSWATNISDCIEVK